MNPPILDSLSHKLLHWFDLCGRKHLPWQQNKTPYRVWISEIMLQQTQVATVIPYFNRFMERFPTIQDLAQAADDEIMHLWSGLGYYSRARNLQRAAKMVTQAFDGIFPSTLEDLVQLPGIGRSTAGAILAIAYNKRAAILDGNVKRVLTRVACITEPLDKVENTLWQLAETCLPQERIADYTQAIMDLGATLCIRGKPQCERCPLNDGCQALQAGIAKDLPKKKIARALPIRSATFLILQNQHEILLQKRPNKGIWGGLWSLPELTGTVELAAIQSYCKQTLKLSVKSNKPLKPFRHTFTHYHLDMHPILLEVAKKPGRIMECEQQIWYNLIQPKSIGLPQPIKKTIRGSP